MATLFECPECDFSTWSEREDEAVAAAEDHLVEHGASDGETVRSGLSVMPSPARSKSGPGAILDERRRRAGRRAADELVGDGMTVGLGTGSTTGWAIARVGERLTEESLDVRGVPTSLQAHELAVEAGIPLVTLDQVETLDVAIPATQEHGLFVDMVDDVYVGTAEGVDVVQP